MSVGTRSVFCLSLSSTAMVCAVFLSTSLAPLGTRASSDTEETGESVPADFSGALEELLAAIEVEENRQGRPTEDLSRLLGALGRYYQDMGNYELAAEPLARSLEILRIHRGLSSLDQASLIGAVMLNAENMGNFEIVRQLEERLIALAADNPEDIRAVALYEEIADRQVAAFERFLDTGTPFNVEINDRVRESYSVNPLFDERGAALAELGRARTNYALATTLIRAGHPDARPRLPGLEEKLVRSYFLEATLRGAMTPGTAYRLGVQSYLRVIEDGAPASRSLALTHTALADWHMLFSRYRPAREHYRQSWGILGDERGDPELLAQLFDPVVPVRLPAFGPDFEPVGESDSPLLAVVIVEVSSYGKASVAEILVDGEDAPPRDLELQIRRAFGRHRFRPRIEAGQPAENGRFTVRYPVAGPEILTEPVPESTQPGD